MFYWSFASLVNFWPSAVFNPGYARVAATVIPYAAERCGGVRGEEGGRAVNNSCCPPSVTPSRVLPVPVARRQ